MAVQNSEIRRLQGRQHLPLVRAQSEIPRGQRLIVRYRLVHKIGKGQQIEPLFALPLPDVAVAVTGAEMVLGGASILLGVKPRAGAALIAGFLAGVSPMMHDFWKHEDPQQRMNEMINFSKNIALLGAALMIMSMEEPWPASVPVAQPDTGFSNLVA